MIRRIAAFAALAAGTITLGTALASSSGPGISADDALNRLMDGNKRYIENQMTGVKTCDVEARNRPGTVCHHPLLLRLPRPARTAI